MRVSEAMKLEVRAVVERSIADDADVLVDVSPEKRSCRAGS